MNTNYYQQLKSKLNSGKLTFCYILCFFSSSLFAQTILSDAELNNRYYTYKDRYLKHFTMIGKERGQSIPIIKITRQVQRVKDKNTGAEKYYTGKIEFGDAMIDMGNLCRCWCYHQQPQLWS
jgi:hypothetical protein